MMEKINVGTHYFQMDVNIFNDSKIQKLMYRYPEGGAVEIYISVLCWLYQEDGVLNASYYPLIANQMRVPVEKVRSVIEDFDLFYFDEGKDQFSSKRVRKDLEGRRRMANGGRKSRGSGAIPGF
jgi:hypothetical protein